MLVAVWLLALADVGLPAPKRPPAPEPATTAVLRKPSYGGPAINAASGAGPQIAVDGAVLWVTYTLADAAGSRIL
ncbi:MAG TPA: hypothetical protein VEI97_19140, partial [bacterium]|nr:hypothetical protein [bacterium]